MKYEQEELNYFRLGHVVFNLVPVGLGQIFKQEWDFLYETTPFGEWKDTSQNGLDFYNNESKLSLKKNARCLATIQNGNTAEWDCTCLFFAILYSDSIGKTLRSAVYNNVDDIRQVRNEIAHIKEAKVTDADFQTSVDRVLNAFASLGLPVTEIQEIKKQTTFPTEELKKIKEKARDLQAELDQTKSDLQERESRLQSAEADLVSAREENKALTQEISAKLQPFCILTSSPPHKVIRRSHDIERITNKMEELYGGANGAISTVYLSGNPGCGKSQLAREIGQEFFSKQTGELTFVATLNAESLETLAESYLKLGRHVGITEYTQKDLESLKRKKPDQAIKQLHRLILPNVSKFTKWLIIADNVVELRRVRDFLPQTGSKEWGHGQLLITTQDRSTIPYNDAPCTYHESLSKGMKRADAMKLLENVSQVTDHDQVKAGVVEALDYQPLALAAAAYYVQTVVNSGSSNYDWTKYLHETSTYEKQEAIESLLANDNSAYPKTTLVAVEMALRRAIETDEVLRQTFSFLAICAHDDLPIEAILQFVNAKLKNLPEELIKVKILRSSLILNYSEEGSERTYLHLHSIVHVAVKRGKVLNMQSSENDHNMAEAVKVFHSLLEGNKKKYAILKKLTPHCKSFLNHMTSDFASEESVALKTLIQSISLTRVIEWLGTLAWVSYEFCDLLFAENVADLACNLLKKDEGDLNASTKAMIFNVSGCVYETKGKYDQAEELLKQALMIRETIFGDAAVAESCNNLALVYSRQGKYDQAIEHYEKGLRIGEKIFSKDPVYEATNCDNLASVYREKGDYWKAEELHKRALTIFEKDEIFAKEQAICYDHLGSHWRLQESRRILSKSNYYLQKDCR